MWATLKHKLQGFFYGLMLGLLIGGGFFILKLDSYFKELNFYKQNAQKKEVKENKTDDQIQNKNSKNANAKIVNVWSAAKKDSVQLALNKLKNELVADSANVTDSAFTANANKLVNKNEEIIVKKDELLASKSLAMINLSAITANTSKDSLLQKVSGVRDDKNNSPASMLVEFWVSPINYKGYKMSKNKVILFGLQEQNVMKFYKTDEGIYLKTLQGVYKLELTDEFRNLDRINDEIILARLK